MTDKIMEYALQRAREIPFIKGQQRHYCVIVDSRGRIVSEASNSYIKTHPVMKRASVKIDEKKECLHAEAHAMIRSKGKGVRLVVCRVNKNGKSMPSPPCAVCVEISKEYQNIKSIEFSL